MPGDAIQRNGVAIRMTTPDDGQIMIINMKMKSFDERLGDTAHDGAVGESMGRSMMVEMI